MEQGRSMICGNVFGPRAKASEPGRDRSTDNAAGRGSPQQAPAQARRDAGRRERGAGRGIRSTSRKGERCAGPLCAENGYIPPPGLFGAKYADRQFSQQVDVTPGIVRLFRPGVPSQGRRRGAAKPARRKSLRRPILRAKPAANRNSKCGNGNNPKIARTSDPVGRFFVLCARSGWSSLPKV